MSPSFVGILNQGNTCYLNSALQVLYHLRPFRRFIFELDTSGRDPNKVVVALKSLFAQMECRVKNISTVELTTAFGWTPAMASAQHDVHELIQQLFDLLETACKGSKKESFIRDLFYGNCIYRSEVVDGADYVADRPSGFYDLELTVKNMSSITDSLNHLIKPEEIEGVSLELTNGAAPTKHKISRTNHLLEVPPVLLIHPNRVDFDRITFEPITLANRWTFPKDLCLADYMIAHSSLKLEREYANKKILHRQALLGPNYVLHSIIIHSGDTEIGHYYSLIRDGDQWLRFNDEYVDVVGDEDVEKAAFGGRPPRPYPHFDNERATVLVYVNTDSLAEVLAPVEVPQEIQEFGATLAEVRKQSAKQVQFKFYFANAALVDWLDRVPDVRSFIEGEVTIPQTLEVSAFLEAAGKVLGQKPESLRLWNYVSRHGFYTAEAVVDVVPYSPEYLIVQQVSTQPAEGEEPFFAFLRILDAKHPTRPVTAQVFDSREALMSALPKHHTFYHCYGHPHVFPIKSMELLEPGKNVVGIRDSLSESDLLAYLEKRAFHRTPVFYLDRLRPGTKTELLSIAESDLMDYRTLQAYLFDQLQRNFAQLPEKLETSDHLAFHPFDKITGEPRPLPCLPTMRGYGVTEQPRYLRDLTGPRHELYVSFLPFPLKEMKRVQIVFAVGYRQMFQLYVRESCSTMTLRQLLSVAVSQVGAALPRRLKEQLIAWMGQAPDTKQAMDPVARLLMVFNGLILREINQLDELIDFNTTTRRNDPVLFVLDRVFPRIDNCTSIPLLFCSRRSGEEYFGYPTNVTVSSELKETGSEVLLRVAKKLGVPPELHADVRKWRLAVKGPNGIRTVGPNDVAAKIAKEAGGPPIHLLVDRPHCVELDGISEEAWSAGREQAIVFNPTAGDQSQL